MKYLIPVLGVVLCCLLSCTTKQKKETNIQQLEVEAEVIRVDLKNEYKERPFPNINYSMDLYTLEDHDDYPIGTVDKLIVERDRFYLLDFQKARALFIYSRDGAPRMLHVINSVGSGPGEFTLPMDFDVDKKTGNIIILDANTRKLIFYSREGEFIKEVKFDFAATSFKLEKDGNILLDSGNIPSPDGAYYLKRIDQEGNVLSTFFPANESTLGMTIMPRKPFQINGEELFYLPSMSNNVYVINGDSALLAYHFDFGKDWPSKEFCESVKDIHPMQAINQMNEYEYVHYLNFHQTKDVIHIDFEKDKRYSYYYEKRTGKSLLVDMENKKYTFPLTTAENKFVFISYRDTGQVQVRLSTVDFSLAR